MNGEKSIRLPLKLIKFAKGWYWFILRFFIDKDQKIGGIFISRGLVFA